MDFLKQIKTNLQKFVPSALKKRYGHFGRRRRHGHSKRR
jgi:hypothetical protein